MTFSASQSLVWGTVLLCSQALAGDGSTPVYQWVDKQGQVHFGDKPVDGSVRPLEFQVPPVNGAGSENQAAQQRLLQVMTAERQQKKQAKEQARAQRVEQQRHCDELAEQLNDLQDGHFVYYRENAAGEREYLDDEARSRREDEYRILFQRECS